MVYGAGGEEEPTHIPSISALSKDGKHKPQSRWLAVQG